MKHYKILLFDLDGVIFDFDKTEQHAFYETFEKYGLPVSKEIFEHYAKINHQLWHDFEEGKVTKDEVTIGRFVKLFKDYHFEKDATMFAKDYQDGLAHGMFLIENAKEVLEKVSQHYRLYAVTNGVSSTAFSRLRGTDTLKYFKDVFVSEDLNAQKPSLEYFHQVFDRIEDFNADETLLIGDTLNSDILGAQLAGIDSCWINSKGVKNTLGIEPTYEIKKIEELFQYLCDMN